MVLKVPKRQNGWSSSKKPHIFFSLVLSKAAVTQKQRKAIFFVVIRRLGLCMTGPWAVTKCDTKESKHNGVGCAQFFTEKDQQFLFLDIYWGARQKAEPPTLR